MRIEKEVGPVHNDRQFGLYPLKILKVFDMSLKSSEKTNVTSSVVWHKVGAYGSMDGAV